VTANGKQIDFLQSKDSDGYWHVAFNLGPQSTTHATISGFAKPSMIPEFPVNSRGIILIVIPVVAVVISIIIWKKKKD
jgi:hypothetical protein